MVYNTKFSITRAHRTSKPFELMVLATALALIAISLAWAAGSPTPNGQNPAGTSLALSLAIAYLSRRRKIGGWLLYFYLQLFSSLVVTLILLPQTLTALVPTQWDSASRYVWYLVGTIPTLLTMIAEIGLGLYLLWRRTEPNIVLLRKVLIALFLVSVISLIIDIKYFSETVTVIADSLNMGFSAIWSIYFRYSKRVRLVFIEQNWDYNRQQSEVVPLTPKELNYARKRALVVGLVIFVIQLLVMGNDLGEQKPDVEIFFVPLFCGAMAALMGRYLPISKRKRLDLQTN